MALALPRYDLDERHHQHLNPFSAHNSSSSLHGRAHSIDMSIELEHQLQLEEEFTTTTTTNTTTATTTNTTAAMLEPRAVEMDQRVSLDPVVLSGIVANLRESMEELTKERDVLQTRSVRRMRERQISRRHLRSSLSVVRRLKLKLKG